MRRLSFLQVELSDLQGFSGLTFEQYQADRHTRREVERLIENLANACLDIAKIILAAEKPGDTLHLLFGIYPLKRGRNNSLHPE